MALLAAKGTKTATQLAEELGILALQVDVLATENNIELSSGKPPISASKRKYVAPLEWNGQRIDPRIRNKLEVIQEANGTKTARDLAEILGCRDSTIRELCNRFNLPYVSIENASDDAATWSPQRRKYELEKQIKTYTDQGYSRMEAIEILATVADYLVNIRDPEEPIKRAAAVYSNPSREQLIDQLLSK